MHMFFAFWPHQTRQADDLEHRAYVQIFPRASSRAAMTRTALRRCTLVAYARDDGRICAAGAESNGAFTRLRPWDGWSCVLQSLTEILYGSSQPMEARWPVVWDRLPDGPFSGPAPPLGCFAVGGAGVRAAGPVALDRIFVARRPAEALTARLLNSGLVVHSSRGKSPPAADSGGTSFKRGWRTKVQGGSRARRIVQTHLWLERCSPVAAQAGMGAGQHSGRHRLADTNQLRVGSL